MLCTTLQDPEVEYIIMQISQELKCHCVEAVAHARIQRTKSRGRPKHQNEPELVCLALEQLNECNLTATPSDQDAGFVLMQVCDVPALDEEILEGKGYK